METSIAILSDTQRTLRFERWLLGRKQYDGVRRRIVLDLLNRRPSILILNGDLTAWGSSDGEWKDWRQWMKPLLETNIEIWPVMGNHDYLLNRRRAGAFFERQFPGFTAPFWYAKRVDRTAIVLLDSNYWAMSRENWERQCSCLSKTIGDFERDENIDRIWVTSHHPSRELRNLTASFFASRKTEAWISGHRHQLEDTFIGGKRLITFGGGGGPPNKQNIHHDFGYVLALPNQMSGPLEERICVVRV